MKSVKQLRWFIRRNYLETLNSPQNIHSAAHIIQQNSYKNWKKKQQQKIKPNHKTENDW